MAATVASLLDVGWLPLQPSYWLDEIHGTVAVLGNSTYADAFIINTYKDSVIERKFVDASEHFCGEGLSEGTPSFEALQGVRRRNKKKGGPEDLLHSDFATRIIVGGSSCGSRFGEGCKRCPSYDDSPRHR